MKEQKRRISHVVDKLFIWDGTEIPYEERKVFDDLTDAMAWIEDNPLQRNEEYTISLMIFDEIDETKFTTEPISRITL